MNAGMTETEWLEVHDPTTMFALLLPLSPRKLRLFACACARHVESWLWGEEASWRAISVAEEFADGLRGSNDLASAQAEIVPRLELYPGEPIYDAAYQACGASAEETAGLASFYAANVSTRPCTSPEHDVEAKKVRELELAYQADLFRDIFGNPFRPVAFDPSWHTSTAAAIAKGMYDSRDFAAMPLLADALQDAGCADDRILDHCRGPGPHVKGCWVVDLVLGKE
jgi:hypothetical protein